MKGPGILWMLQTAAGMSMAGPMFYLGATHLLSGRYGWGIGFLLFGAVVLYFPTYLVNRIGGPRAWIRRRVGRGGSTSDEGAGDVDDGPVTEAEDGPVSGADDGRDPESEDESTHMALLDRLRDR